MSSLQNLQISQTFPGLIKTNDELAISPTLKTLQDGAGNNLPMEVSTTGVNFTGTVTGIPATGVTSIVAGTGITVDQATGDVTVSASGGGGGGMEATLYTTGRGVNMVPGSTSSGDLWRTTYVPDTYGTSSSTIANQSMVVTAMGLITGQTVDTFGVYITTATAGGVITAALYKTIIGSDGNIAGGDLEYDFGTIDATTTGLKVINGAGHTLGATTDNTYFLAIWNGSGSTVGVLTVGSTNLSGMLSHMSMYATTAYRGTTYAQTFSSLPATLPIVNWPKRTDFPVYGLKFS